MKSLHIYLAALVAILLQPVVGMITFFPIFGASFPPDSFPDINALFFYAIAVLLASILPILLFGIPCFEVLNKTQKLSVMSMSCCGIFFAMLPYLLIGAPQVIDGYTANAYRHGDLLKLYEGGSPAPLAWLNYLVAALGFGVHGFVAGTVFYLFWRRLKTPARAVPGVPSPE